MTREEAREVLIKVLTRQFMDDLHSDGAYGPEIARRGHIGFESRLDLELVQEALDMGHDYAANVREAIAVLEGP